jgi:hypothetical protein
VQACVFGLQSIGESLEYIENGVTHQYSVGKFIRKLFMKLMFRTVKPYRMMFPIFDEIYVGRDENE